MSCELTSQDIIYKQPGETLNVGINFANWLESDVTISNPTITSDPSGLTVSNISISGQYVLFTVSGGTTGYNYRIQVQVDTSGNEVLIGDGILKVRDR